MQIRIQCRQTVSYDQTIEISEEEWEELKEVTEQEMDSSSYSPLGDMLYPNDCDGEGFRDVTIFEIDGEQRVWKPAE